MTFFVGMSIMPQAGDLAKLQISGELPTLSINFSDQKYHSIMKVVDMLFEDEEDKKKKKEKEERSHARRVFYQFPARPGSEDTDEPLLLHESEEGPPPRSGDAAVGRIDSAGSLEEDGEDEEFFDAPDTLAIGSQREDDTTPDDKRVTVDFTFRVGKFVASVLQSHLDEDGQHQERYLADLHVDSLSIKQIERPFDRDVTVIVRRILVHEKMSEQPHCILYPDLEPAGMRPASTTPVGSGAEGEEGGDPATGELVRIEYHRVTKESPDYMSVYEGIGHHVDAFVNRISLRVNASTILTLYDFMLKTFTDVEKPATRPMTPLIESIFGSEGGAPIDRVVVKSDETDASDTIRVKARLKGVNFYLHEAEQRLRPSRWSRATWRL